MFGIKSKFSFTAEFAEHAEFNPPYIRRVNFDFFSAFSLRLIYRLILMPDKRGCLVSNLPIFADEAGCKKSKATKFFIVEMLKLTI
jgi:hypothetical protein